MFSSFGGEKKSRKSRRESGRTPLSGGRSGIHQKVNIMKFSLDPCSPPPSLKPSKNRPRRKLRRPAGTKNPRPPRGKEVSGALTSQKLSIFTGVATQPFPTDPERVVEVGILLLPKGSE